MGKRDVGLELCEPATWMALVSILIDSAGIRCGVRGQTEKLNGRFERRC